jgi:hypothetical protein
MSVVMQRWNFMISPGDINKLKVGDATPLLNTVIGVIKPFTVKGIELLSEFNQVLYELKPDVKDDPELEGELLPDADDGEMIAIIIVEGGDYTNGR